VIAADDPQQSEHFPASLPDVLAARTDQRQWFARAEQLSTRSGGGYQVFYGASIAAAGLAGFTAVVRARHSSEETRRIVTSLATCGRDTDGIVAVAGDVVADAMRCD
jgi:hypothetical protein